MAKDDGSTIGSSGDNRDTRDESVRARKVGVPENKHTATKQTVTIRFRENRKFDLHVGREVVVFMGGETKPIPREWLKHPDFVQVQGYFVVKGV